MSLQFLKHILFKHPLRSEGARVQTMSDSLMYRLTYNDFADASMMMTGQRGYDRVRQATIGLMDFK